MMKSHNWARCVAALSVLTLASCGGSGASGEGGSGGGTGGQGGSGGTGGGGAGGGGAGGGGGNDPGPPINQKPAFVGEIATVKYDGQADDLLTAGLGKTGLQSVTPPPLADPSKPTPAELRKLAIYNNYRALADMTTNGGFGVLYGPNLDISGKPTPNEGKIGGTEYIAYADDGTGRVNMTMMVQVPSSFDTKKPCIVTGTSSGSRGVYGAIGTVGEWGLKHGCAVAYTDKGTGTGVHDLQNNTVNGINGARSAAESAAKASNFTAQLSDAERAAFNAATPNRFAFKHAHSQLNPERDWGVYTLQAVQFAFYVLNEQLGSPVGKDGAKLQTFKPSNTIVIASSISNGGGAALAAAEQDKDGLIDGVAVSEPQVQLVPVDTLTVKRGSLETKGSGKPIYDYFTLANLYQPCAAISVSAAGSPGAASLDLVKAQNRCASLKAKGLLTAATLPEQAEEALSILLAGGWQPESNVLHASHFAFATTSVAVNFANSYGRFSVKDNLCGFSFAAVGADSKPAAPVADTLARIFATSGGSPPTGGIFIVNNLNPAGPILDTASVSPSTAVADFNIDGALCLRDLMTGTDENAKRVQTGISEVRRTGNLHGKPALIVHGRADTLVPVAHTSRPYFGVNKIAEGSASQLSYIEVTNAQHFDTFIGLVGGYDTRLVPLHPYLIQALDLMYAHLSGGAALPPSQVVRTIPRGGAPGAAPAITPDNVPPISASPAPSNLITFSANTVTIPD
jgi:hydroxybutyrate-dimer hydrolase